MNKPCWSLGLLLLLLTNCKQDNDPLFSAEEKQAIQQTIQAEINAMIVAVSTKDIETYMRQMPADFIIYDENGEIISREKQREYALRDWSIIDTTLHNEMVVDSISFVSRDSIFVFTSQRWERLMFRRDGITKDTVLTTQRHRELWKKNPQGWMGYTVEELGGSIFINGEKYEEN
ncbi:MAG: hypothetical protein H6555_07315 [Lewinellaceae bacterium]|nr:hypothetical protein [Lewinellaceae bacterium]